MGLADFVAAVEQLAADGVAAFAEAADATSVEQARVGFLGAKQGRLKQVQQLLGGLSATEKPAAGRALNEAKERLQAALEQALARTEQQASSSVALAAVDLTLPGISRALGHRHPITQTIQRLIEIMGRMGFEVAEGPEVEDEWHNFEALNIPADHPARDPLDNFYLANAGGILRLLRSQTSTVQVRVMEMHEPPIRIISLGRVYRPDEADATHFPMFHQIEGLLVARGVTMANLKTTLNDFAKSYLGSEVPIRFRPSFFPFTEPSVEVDLHWQDRWMEFGGAGMVDPAVLAAVGYDPEVFSGFAFGLGVERLCMRRHGITDIRDLYSGDVRFLRQF
jgi:phenylalanyl-tRNA synthetase alpha chain